MARVLMMGGAVTAGEVPGQGCLASIHDGGDESWIFDDQSAAVDEAAAGVGAETAFPVGVTLDHLMELYWRWREVEVEFEVNSDDGSSDVDVSGDFKEERDAEKEYDMVVGEVWDVEGGEVPEDTSSPYPATTFLCEFRMFHLPAGEARRVIFYGGKYWPSMQVDLIMWELADASLGLYADVGYLVSRKNGASGVDADEALTDAGSLVMSDAVEYDFDLFYDSARPTLDVTELSIEASLYWAHEKDGGGAKFDTATGLKL